MMSKRTAFRDFWPIYLRAHQNENCRRIHFMATTGALIGLMASLESLNVLWLLGGIASAYAMAWAAHFCVERNRPATFGNPILSLACDFRMYALWLRGRLKPELDAAAPGVTISGTGAPAVMNVRRAASNEIEAPLGGDIDDRMW